MSAVPKSACLLLLLAVLPAFIAAADIGTEATFVVNELPAPVLSLSALAVSPSSVSSGSSADFTVYLQNQGTGSALATVTVSIRDSGGVLRDSVAFSPVAVLPGATVHVTKAWSSAALQTGDYTAVATASYSETMTTPLSTAFSIYLPTIASPVPVGIPGGLGGGAGPGVPVYLPKEIMPVAVGPAQFVSMPIVREFVQGDRSAFSLSVKNDETEFMAFNLSFTGVPQDWLTISPSASVVPKGQEQPVNLFFKPPSNATPGDYLVQLYLATSGGVTQDFVIVKIKPLTETQNVMVTKSINLDRQKNDTIVSLKVRNPLNTTVGITVVTEEIPIEISGRIKASEIFFPEGMAGRIVSEYPIRIEWELHDLQPDEERELSYKLPIMLASYESYARWAVKQVYSAENKGATVALLKIIGFTIPPLSAGKAAQATLEMMYVGADPQETLVSLEAPQEITVEPASARVLLPPNSVKRVSFSLLASEEAAGSYIVTAYILGVGTQMVLQQTNNALVSKQAALPWPLLAGVAVLLLASVAAIYFLGKREPAATPPYEDRKMYLSQLKQAMEDKKA